MSAPDVAVDATNRGVALSGSPNTGLDRPYAAIEIDVRPRGRPGFAASVRLRGGEHDLATSIDLERALRSIEGNVLVDMTDCDFIDSTVLAALEIDAQRRELDENRLELIVPEANRRVALVLEMTGLDGFFTVHEPRDPGTEGA